METHRLADPARFAPALRDLAREAHRTLTDAPALSDLRRIARRIDVLSAALGDRREGPVAAWLDSLGREVRSAAARRVEARRSMCLCA